jgi:hypothetical protein
MLCVDIPFSVPRLRSVQKDRMARPLLGVGLCPGPPTSDADAVRSFETRRERVERLWWRTRRSPKLNYMARTASIEVGT